MSVGELTRCSGCPFQHGRLVGSRGRIDAPVVIVGESPGVQEVRLKQPFVGPSGQVLWSACPKRDKTAEDVLLLNALQCQPKGKKDQKLLSVGAHACHERLMAEIQAYPRKLVIALGNAALWSLTGNYGLKITRERGRLLPSSASELGVLPAVHPAALLRGTSNYRLFKEDIRYGFRIANGEPLKRNIEAKYIIVCDTERKIQAALDDIARFRYAAADLETEGFDHISDQILSLGICVSPTYAYIFPPEALQHTKDMMESGKVRMIWHNGKFDVKFLRQIGIQARVHEDTMLLSYCLDETGGIHDLEQVGNDVIGAPDYKHMLDPYLPKKGTSYAVIPKPILYQYQGIDCSNTLQIFEVLREQVREDPRLEKLYTKVLIPSSELLARVEAHGLLPDVEWLDDIAEMLKAEIEEKKEILKEIAREDINPNSTYDIARILFDKFKMRKIHGRSTAKEVLEKLPKHPFVEALKEYRKAAKAYSTYVVGPRSAIRADGRVHPTFKIHGTRTGRLSCAQPNVQNIPRDPMIRGVYVAPPGRRFLEIDLNQAELRSLAATSGDEFLCRIFNSQELNLHDEMTETLFPGWKGRGGETTFKGHEERMMAKTVNFGIPYGREAKSIAEVFNITVPEAQRMIDGWFKRAPKAHDYIQKCRSVAIKGGTIYTNFGRLKRHLIVTRENIRSIMNEASNFPHQSIASDINTSSAMAVTMPEYEFNAEVISGLNLYLSDYDSFIINLIHDACLMETPDDFEIQAKIATGMMQVILDMSKHWGITRVPMLSDAKTGYRWGYLEKFKVEKGRFDDREYSE